MSTDKNKGYTLNACPKCGYRYPELTGALSAPESWVYCPKCKSKTEFFSGTENAIEAWNNGELEVK